MSTDPRDLALAHAMWDSVNSIRMERPDDIHFHVQRAHDVRHFLRMRGFDVERITLAPRGESPHRDSA